MKRKKLTIKLIAFVEDSDDPLDIKLYRASKQLSSVVVENAVVGKKKFLMYAVDRLADSVFSEMLEADVI